MLQTFPSSRLSSRFAAAILMAGAIACAAQQTSPQAPAQDATAQDITGTWLGLLQTPVPGTLRIVNTITRDDKGKLQLLDYSIDQTATPFHGTLVSFKKGVLTYTIQTIPHVIREGYFVGKLSADGQTITGTWTQGGGPNPLNFKRVTLQPDGSIAGVN